MLAVGFTNGVVGSGNDNEFEGLVGFDEGIGDLHGAGGVHIIIEFSDNEHQRTFEAVGIFDIRTFDVGRIYRVGHPLFIPPDLIHPVVVATTGAVGGLVEITMEKNSSRALLSSSRTAINAHFVNIHIGIFGGSGLDPGDSVGESCIFQVLIANLFKLLASIAGSHGIELYDDEAKFCERCGVAVVWLEGLGDVAVAWA